MGPGADDEAIMGQWAALEEFKASGRARSIAVSNFLPRQLDVVLDMKGTVPALNQLAYGVGIASPTLIFENSKRGIPVQAWGPLGRARYGSLRSTCEKIGQKYDKTAVQVALRWIVD